MTYVQIDKKQGFWAFDNHYVVYYDAYQRPQHVGPVRSYDLEHWEDVTAQLSFPWGLKHDSFLWITQEEAERLQRC